MIPLVIVAVFFALVFGDAYDLHKSMQRVERIDRAVDKATELLKILLESEAGMRGFLVTGDDSFLQPYDQGRSQVGPQLDILMSLAGDNPQQRQRLLSIRADCEAWQLYAWRMILVRRESGTYDSDEFNRMEQTEMDRIRAGVSEFQGEEERSRNRYAAGADWRWSWLFLSCLSFAVIGGTALALWTRRQMRAIADSFTESINRLSESEQRWAATVSSISDGVILAGRDGNITFVNPAAAALTGWEPEEAIDRPVGDVLRMVAEISVAAGGGAEQVRADESASDGEEDVSLIRKDGRKIPIDRSRAEILDRARAASGVALVFRDATRKRRVLAEQLALLDLAHDGIMVLDRESRISFWNRGAEVLYGYSKAQATGKVSHELLRTVFPMPWTEIHELLMRNGFWEGELIHTSAQGQPLTVESRWGFQRGETEDQARMLEITKDITLRKQAEHALQRQSDELRQLTASLQNAREEERRRVARDLHDQIGQILTAIKFDGVWIGRRLQPEQEDVRSRVDGLLETVDGGIQAVRDICAGLRPPLLDDIGLVAAIEWLAGDFSARSGIACRVTAVQNDIALKADCKIAVFRILQEALTNVMRHAGAQAVQVSLRTQDCHLLVSLDDDGRGFEERSATRSLGLLGMKERAQACGGNLQISSTPGAGTKVEIRIPFSAN